MFSRLLAILVLSLTAALALTGYAQAQVQAPLPIHAAQSVVQTVTNALRQQAEYVSRIGSAVLLGRSALPW